MVDLQTEDATQTATAEIEEVNTNAHNLMVLVGKCIFSAYKSRKEEPSSTSICDNVSLEGMHWGFQKQLLSMEQFDTQKTFQTQWYDFVKRGVPQENIIKGFEDCTIENVTLIIPSCCFLT